MSAEDDAVEPRPRLLGSLHWESEMTQPPEQSPTDEAILAYIAEGKPHAEIAARLGLPIGEVKRRIERLNSPPPPPLPPVHVPKPRLEPLPPPAQSGHSAALALGFGAIALLGVAAYFLSQGGDATVSDSSPAAFGTVRAVIESGTRTAGPGEPWTLVDDAVFREARFSSANEFNLEGGFVLMDAETGAGSAWALPPELDRAPWANQLSNDLRWIVSGGPGETFAYDRKLDRTLRWPQGGVRILASFGEATLFQEFHTMTGENDPQGGAFRLWRDGEPRSQRLAWPLDAPLPPFDAPVSVEGRFATIAFSRLQDLHVVRFDVVTGEFSRYWRAGLRSSEDSVTGLYPMPMGFFVTVEPVVEIADLDGIDLYHGEWQGAPAAVLAHHFAAAQNVVPSPDSAHFAVSKGSGGAETGLGVSDVPSVVIYSKAFQPVGLVLSASVDEDPWFEDGTQLALRTSRGALVLEVESLALGPLRLANRDIVESERLSPFAGGVLVGGWLVRDDPSGLRRVAESGFFAYPRDPVWSADGTEFGFVLPGAADSGYVDGSWPAPVVDAIPFADSPAAVVANAETCADLLESPSSQANVLDCLPNGATLTIAAVPPDVPDDSGLVASGVAFWTDEREAPRRHFVRVAAEDGGEGWLALEHLEWAP